MSKRRSVKSLVKAAIAGVHASGIEVATVEVSQEGRVVVFPRKSGAVTAHDANPWDQVLDHAQD
jgi:hypothetical protein